MSPRLTVTRKRRDRFGFMPSRFKRQTMQVPDLSQVLVAASKPTEKAPGIQSWQDVVLKYADRVPIVSAAERYYIEATKQIRYYLVDRTTGEAVDSAHPADDIIDTLNKYNEEVARAVGLRFLIGEARMTYDHRTDELNAYGAGELYNKGDTIRVRTRDGKDHDIDPALAVWRSYDPDRKWSELATSSLKPLRDVMEAIVIAYAEERAVSIRQTMNAGIVMIHESVFAVGGTEDAVNSEGSGPGAALEARFHKMLGMTINDPRMAAGFSPAVVVVGGEDRDVSKMVAHVGMAADRDKRKIAERLDMLKTEIAIGIDLPSDQAAGFLKDMNHWNGRLVKQNEYTNYVAPKVTSVAGDAFVEIAEHLNIDIDGVYIALDSSELVIPEDMTETALTAHKQLLISDKAARQNAGFSEDDAPTEEDPNTYIEPLPFGQERSSGDESGDQEVSEDSSEGVTAAAATDGPDLKRFNKALSKARYKFEAALREKILEIGAEREKPYSREDKIYDAGRIADVVMSGNLEMSRAAAKFLKSKKSQEWYDRHHGRLFQRAQRAGDIGVSLIEAHLPNGIQAAGEGGVPVRSSYGIGRAIESVAAGGAPTLTNTRQPTGSKPMSLVDDADFHSMILDETGGSPFYTWEHGVPSQSFTPHEELDGATWTAEDEDSVLSNDYDYPPGPTFYPGDHDGCTCRIEVEFG